MTDAIDIAGLDEPPVAEDAGEADESDPSRAAWLRRRGHGFGASEVAVLLVALGMRDASILPSYLAPDARPIRVCLRPREKAVAVPRILLEKAGLRRPRAIGDAAREGAKREPCLVAQWTRMVERGTAGPDAAGIDPASIVYWPALGLPELLPLRDAEEPRLTCSPDVLARSVFDGALGCVDTKCSFDAYSKKYRAAPEHQRIQVVSQMAVTSGEWGAIVEGEGWAATYRDHMGRPRGPIVTWPVRRDEPLVREIRRACALGWERVEGLRAQRMEVAA